MEYILTQSGYMESFSSATDLLSSDDYKRPLEYASVGQRFLNHLIDIISFYAITFLLGIIIALGGGIAFIESLDSVNPLLDRLVSMIIYACYVGTVEGLSGGKSLGKTITRTRAVYEDGSKIKFSTGFLRGLSRAVPFEIFSALSGYPWHDSWTDTRVVKESSLE
jgi:uncharacterized RDD family membrane protein YckC